jgi:zinc protease
VRRQLPNALTVYVIEDHRLPVVTYALEILAGNCDVEPSHSGLPSLVAGLLREGAGAHTSPEISALVDGCGGSMGAGAGDDITTAGGTFMKSYAALGLELLADIVLRPRFPEDEIDRRVQQVLSGLAVNLDDPSYLVSLVASRVIYGPHPYAYPGDGTPATIGALGRDDLVSFWKRCYAPHRAWFAVSGDVTPEEGFRLAEQAFGDWKGDATVLPAVLPPPIPRGARVVIVDMPQAVQTQLSIGHTGIPRNHPDFTALNVANQIFGGSFNSRLNMKIRAKEGLTYDASSGFEAQRQAGLFTVNTFTRTEKTAEALRLIVDLLQEFHDDPAQQDEFDEAKSYIHGSFALATETSGQVAERILAAAVHGLGEEYWTSYRERLEALTIGQVRAAVQRFIEPAKLSIVAVGDARAFSTELAAYGPTTVIPQAELDLVAATLRTAITTQNDHKTTGAPRHQRVTVNHR